MTGTQIGSFTIVAPLGERGTGSVYLAEHAVLKMRRAVKLIPPQRTENAALVERFVHEARAAARLHHRNLIQLHDVGQLASGAWFMMLDYLDGHTLGRFLARRVGPIPPQLIVHIVSEIANGLQIAHHHELVHRDLTPENVFLISREGDPHHVVLIGAGIAQRGTPAYMSPELLRGDPAGPSGDVFALGVIAYQMSTGGWFPYQHGESRQGYCALPADELYARLTTGAPVDPRERWPSLDTAWAEALLSAVCGDPALRPASAAALALRLAEAVPPIGLSPGGLEIVRTYARELVDGGAGLDTMRLLRPPAEPVEVVQAESRYQIDHPIGSGGMAEVFAGTMIGVEGFARRVAIKRVRAGLSSIPSLAAMFVSEARIASRLVHSNIVSVLDFSRDRDGRLLLVMELVDGVDLARVLERGPIAPSLAIFIMVELLRGLGYAHDLADPASGTRGVIHRDVSPQNLLLSREGAVKLSDFGLAKVRAATGGVQSETVRGKPGYMAPEQCSGGMLDGRTDLYAAGVMLWEMLAYRPLFVGTPKEITAQVMFHAVPMASSVRRVPADLEAIAMKLLAPAPADRYQTAQAAIDALLACRDAPRDGRGELVALLAERFSRTAGALLASPLGLRAGPITISDLPIAAVAAAPVEPAAAVPRVRRPRRRALALSVSGAALACAVALVVIARGEPAPSVTTAHPPPFAAAVAGLPPADAAIAVPPVSDAGGASVPLAPSLPAARVAPPASAQRLPPTSVPPMRSERAARTGELAILVKPWAMIWLNGKPSGQTPFRAPMPIGRYRVRLANDDVGQAETTTVVVEADQTTTIERSW